MKGRGVLSGKVKMARSLMTEQGRADLVASNLELIQSVAIRHCPEQMRSLWLEDIVSEAFMRVYKGLENYQGDVEVGAFIRGCVKKTRLILEGG